MIVVDSSALVAILENEPEAQRFVNLLHEVPRRLMSAVNVYETGIVIGMRRGRERIARLTGLLDEMSIEIIPFVEPYISGALDAYMRYGKGIDPKARLNLGDCAAYALAKAVNAPLLFKGKDFAATDVLRSG
ncbi:MAG: ribonuclease VapC [Hyphomicrobiales bacterium]|jgi:ribonuclease VapC|nr:ribonuclease VapC [Hyphomicrobiales bacterium]